MAADRVGVRGYEMIQYTDIGSVRGVGIALIGLAATEVVEERLSNAVQIAAAAERRAATEGIATSTPRSTRAARTSSRPGRCWRPPLRRRTRHRLCAVDHRGARLRPPVAADDSVGDLRSNTPPQSFTWPAAGRPSGSLLEGCEASAAPVGITVISGHSRVITVHATVPVGGRSAGTSPTSGCNGLQSGCTDATRPGQKVLLTKVFLVAGAGFEPATFGLAQRPDSLQATATTRWAP